MVWGGAWIQRVMSESLGLQSVRAGSFLLVTNQCRNQQNYMLNKNYSGLQLPSAQTLCPWGFIELSHTCEMKIIKTPTLWCCHEMT